MCTVDELVDRMTTLGFDRPDAARRALDAALGAVAEALTEEESAALAANLPEPLAQIVREVSFDGVVDASELYERARRRGGVAPGCGIEHTQIALRVLGDALDEETRTRLRRALPLAIGALLVPADEGAPPPQSAPPHSAPIDSLASGRPGSRHPLSEARADRTQAHSVVREANPHGDTKLSSAHGTTQERLGETLASGKPPSPATPLDDAHDRRRPS